MLHGDGRMDPKILPFQSLPLSHLTSHKKVENNTLLTESTEILQNCFLIGHYIYNTLNISRMIKALSLKPIAYLSKWRHSVL